MYEGFLNCPGFVMQYFVMRSSLASISLRKRKLVALLLIVFSLYMYVFLLSVL